MVTKPLQIDGVDTSHHQSGELNLSRAKKAGVKFWYHKSTEGAGFRDAKYTERRREAAAAGIPFGAYHFAHPQNGDASIEAKFFLQTAKPQPGDLVPVLDLEVNDNNMSRAELTRWVGNWVAQIQRSTGVKPIIYTPFDLDRNFGCLLWQPRYNNNNTPPNVVEPWNRWDIWQFSNGDLGRPNEVPGFGKVDINTLRDGLRVREFRIPVEPEEPRTKTQTGKLRFVSQNVQALPLMPQDDVMADVLLTASQATVVGWQEIGPRRYDEAVASLDPRIWTTFWAGHRNVGGYESPISFRHNVFTAVKGDAVLFQPANAGISRAKYFTWLILEHNRTKARIIVTNKHYVSSAFSKKSKKYNKQRPVIWRAGRDEVELPFLRDIMEKHPNYAVVNLGDYNAYLADGGRDVEEYPRRINNRPVHFLTGPRSIDQVMFINGKNWKWQIDDEDGTLLPGRNSDHQGRKGEGSLKKVNR